MARMFPEDIDQYPKGELIVEAKDSDQVDIYFIPPKESLAESLEFKATGKIPKVLLLNVNGVEDLLTIYPLNTRGGHPFFLGSKYRKIESLVLEGFGIQVPHNSDEVNDILEYLPEGFVKDYNYGLGLLKDYRFLIEVLEEHSISCLVISKKQETRLDREAMTCILGSSSFGTIRKSIDKITRQSREAGARIKSVTTNNLLAFFLNDDGFMQRKLEVKDTTLERLIVQGSSAAPIPLTQEEQKEAIDLVSKNNKTIAKEQPEELVRLHNEIELVTLERLIETFEEMLAKNRSESYWQALFNTNPFILSLVFGYPIIKVKDQAHLGGRKISGAGDKITDFLTKNKKSNNAAVFEIKTPAEKLLNGTPYREAIYTPSTYLTGAMNQLLDQKSKFQQEIAPLKHNSRINDLEAYAVHGVLIIGTMPDDFDQIKSFELFRGNSKDVSIITFDELLEKLKQLLTFLSPQEEVKVIRPKPVQTKLDF